MTPPPGGTASSSSLTEYASKNATNRPSRHALRCGKPVINMPALSRTFVPSRRLTSTSVHRRTPMSGLGLACADWRCSPRCHRHDGGRLQQRRDATQPPQPWCSTRVDRRPATAAADSGCRWVVAQTAKPDAGTVNPSTNNMIGAGLPVLYARPLVALGLACGPDREHGRPGRRLDHHHQRSRRRRMDTTPTPGHRPSPSQPLPPPRTTPSPTRRRRPSDEHHPTESDPDPPQSDAA